MPFIKKILLTALILCLSINLYAEYLFLKDGSIIKGTIISETAAYINFRNEERKTERYPRDQIMRVLYTELNMGKVFVQRRDGKVETAYMVDEDRTTYTFRKNLYKPAEFTMKRADVLFMAERNPTGLKGEPETDRVSLEWLPSFEKMKHYNIYYRKKGEKFGPPVKSGKTSYVLKNLTSNTEYTVKVTGFAGDGDETTSSNEYTFVTKNIAPDSPDGINVIITEKGEAKVTWEPASDVDGKVVEYRIYGINGKERKLLGKSVQTTFNVSNATAFERITVRAVDNSGDESGDARARRAIEIQVSGTFNMPMADYSDLLGPGGGCQVSFYFNDVFIYNLRFGLTTGVYYYPGKNTDEISTSYGVPLAAQAAWKFHFSGSKYYIAPRVSGGIVLNKINYTQEYIDTFVTEPEDSGKAGLLSAGMEFGFNISDRHVIVLITEYSLMFESTIFHFITAGAGYGIRF